MAPWKSSPSNYFHSTSRTVAEGTAWFCLYWIGEELAAFNLLLLGRDTVIDKFLGHALPAGADAQSVRAELDPKCALLPGNRRRRLQSGQTAYRSKLRLGSTLAPRRSSHATEIRSSTGSCGSPHLSPLSTAGIPICASLR